MTLEANFSALYAYNLHAFPNIFIENMIVLSNRIISHNLRIYEKFSHNPRGPSKHHSPLFTSGRFGQNQFVLNRDLGSCCSQNTMTNCLPRLYCTTAVICCSCRHVFSQSLANIVRLLMPHNLAAVELPGFCSGLYFASPHFSRIRSRSTAECSCRTRSL